MNDPEISPYDDNASDVREQMRRRLLERAGIFCSRARKRQPTIDQIYAMQWDAGFERLMRNRMAMGYFRYGALKDQIGNPKFDNLASIRSRLDKYESSKNRELLADIAGLCMVEFATHPDYPFKAADDGEHAPRLPHKNTITKEIP